MGGGWYDRSLAFRRDASAHRRGWSAPASTCSSVEALQRRGLGRTPRRGLHRSRHPSRRAQPHDRRKRYWLMKSEPQECSIDDALAAPDATVPWTGVRNYQARNFMRDDMRVGDGVLFYHSSCPEPGIAGIARVASAAYPDETQFDATSKYFDEKASREQPRWFLVDVAFERKLKRADRARRDQAHADSSARASR
jgi:predicted RNA-binding protein with PUA-like domain